MVTSYNYTNNVSLAAIDYSDATPDVSFQYDRLGRMTSASDGVAARVFSYDTLGVLSSEAVTGPYALTLTRGTDSLGRPNGIALSGVLYESGYSYDLYGRFTAVTSKVTGATQGFVYGYLPDTDLIETLQTKNVLGAVGQITTRTYDPVMPYITRVHNGFGTSRTISQYDYTYDALGRRTAIASSGEAFTYSNVAVQIRIVDLAELGSWQIWAGGRSAIEFGGRIAAHPS